jgi:hypothetical protein
LTERERNIILVADAKRDVRNGKTGRESNEWVGKQGRCLEKIIAGWGILYNVISEDFGESGRSSESKGLIHRRDKKR